jgi:hypothetical protein
MFEMLLSLIPKIQPVKSQRMQEECLQAVHFHHCSLDFTNLNEQTKLVFRADGDGRRLLGVGSSII